MSFTYTRTVTFGGCGMPMMPMAPMMPMMGGCCSPMMRPPLFCRPYPMMAACGAVAAGVCAGALIANPQIINGIGNAFKWGYNSVIKPVWNSAIKPALGFIGQGLKWVWDHTLGWVIKKISKKSEQTPKADESSTQTQS